jgi:hypothetical protein
MSAIASSLSVDTPHPRRSLSAKPHGAASEGAGNPGKFSDLLAIGLPSADTGLVSLAPNDEDAAPDTGDKAAADSGNVLPTGMPIALPAFAELVAAPTQPAPTIESTIASPAIVAKATTPVARSPDGIPTVPVPQDGKAQGQEAVALPTLAASASNAIVLPPPSGSDTATAPQPAGSPAPDSRVVRADSNAALVKPIDTAMLDALTRATIPAAGTTPPTPQTAGGAGFRLVFAEPRVEPIVTTPAAPALPSGPLSVTQPAQGASTIGLLAGALRSLSTASEDRDDATEPLVAGVTGQLDPIALAGTDGARPVVATTATADQSPLDMTQQHWPQAMIDRIDRMREDAATADTRIQLSPDALGGIAVAIRRDDDRTHIHFTAEQSHTATMLADAHATLARLAEDKGLRLGSMAVNAGAFSGSDLGQSARDQRQPTPAATIPARPPAPDADPFRDSATGMPADAAASTRIA